MKFKAISDPDPATIDRISQLDPANPFHTNEYARVRARLGARTVAFIQEENRDLSTACLGFLTRGKVNSRIEITSLPAIAERRLFWQGIFASCRKLGISSLSVYSFASEQTDIPTTRHRLSWKQRSEYRLDLLVPDLSKVITRRHRRQINSARNAGLELAASDEPKVREVHVQLANLSLDRLRGRGESINSEITSDLVDAFLDEGAGRIFQAVANGEVFASILVAVGRTGAYAQSSGSSAAGRSIGASHFLFHETACFLRSEGFAIFNLGGADQDSTGLQDFKLGLGAKKLDLESAEFYTGGILRKIATRAAAILRH